MSKLFFDQLNIPEPDVNLDVGSGSHAKQTVDIMKAFEPVLLEYKPDAIKPGKLRPVKLVSYSH